MVLNILYGGIFPTDIAYKSTSTITAGTFGVISDDNEIDIYGAAKSRADVLFLENSSDVKNPEYKISCVTGTFILETDQFVAGTYTPGNYVYIDDTTKKLIDVDGTATHTKVGVILAVGATTITVLVQLPTWVLPA
jgi:hypothetical protein